MLFRKQKFLNLDEENDFFIKCFGIKKISSKISGIFEI